MELEHALATIQARGLFLCYDERYGVDLWTPATKVPITLRRAVFRYADVLAELMHEGNVRVCPNPRLHRRYYRHKKGQNHAICAVCARLEPEMWQYPVVDYSTNRANRAS